MVHVSAPPFPRDAVSGRTHVAGDPTRAIFWACITAHVVGWTIVPALAQRSLPYDTIEMLYSGREWQWGYHKHPPVPAWMAAACWQVFGSVDWPLYLIGQLCVAVCFWAAWRLARDVLPPWPALAAALLLEACPFLNYTTPQWNNNGPTKPCWALAVMLLYFAIRRRDWRCWIGAGAALGVGLMSKYDGVLLIAAMLGFLIVHPAARWALRTPGPALMLGTAGLLFAPHVVWAASRHVPAADYLSMQLSARRSWVSHVRQPLFFLVAQVGAVIGIPLLLGTVFGWRWRPAPLDDRRRFMRDYLAFVVLGPLLLALVPPALTGMRMVALWGSPMWTMFPLLLLVAFEPVAPAPSDAFLRLVRRCAACGVLLLAAFAVAKVFHGELSGKLTRVQYPGRELARLVDERWRAVADRPLEMIGGDWWAAGLAAFYGPDRPHVYPELRADWAPWTNDDDFRRSGGVILWLGGNPDKGAPFLERFPDAVVQQPIELRAPGVFRDLSARIGIAILPPRDGPSRAAQSGAAGRTLTAR